MFSFVVAGDRHYACVFLVDDTNSLQVLAKAFIVGTKTLTLLTYAVRLFHYLWENLVAHQNNTPWLTRFSFAQFYFIVWKPSLFSALYNTFAALNIYNLKSKWIHTVINRNPHYIQILHFLSHHFEKLCEKFQKVKNRLPFSSY